MTGNEFENHKEKEAVITWLKQQVLASRCRQLELHNGYLCNLNTTDSEVHMSGVIKLASMMGWTVLTINRNVSHEYTIECSIMYEGVKFFSIYTVNDYEREINAVGL